jgi:hypothetical protein
MAKFVINERDLERTQDLSIGRMEIVVDDSTPDRVELYILDEVGSRLEGGTFSLSDFMTHVAKFYHENY